MVVAFSPRTIYKPTMVSVGLSCFWSMYVVTGESSMLQQTTVLLVIVSSPIRNILCHQLDTDNHQYLEACPLGPLLTRAQELAIDKTGH